jgi:hypothetical protein
MLEVEQELKRLQQRLSLLERRPSGSAEWMNETEASRYIGRHDEYLRKLRLAGKGPPATRSGRQWMRQRSALDAFMAEDNR